MSDILNLNTILQNLISIFYKVTAASTFCFLHVEGPSSSDTTHESGGLTLAPDNKLSVNNEKNRIKLNKSSNLENCKKKNYNK